MPLPALHKLLTAVAAVATTATVLAAPTVTDAVSEAAAGDRSGDVRMNEIQFMGAHNGYHREMQGEELEGALQLDPEYRSWAAYSHASIPNLLGRQHVRHVELDLLPDPEGGLYRWPLARKKVGMGPIEDPAMSQPGMKVLHVPDKDYGTTCRTFVLCLTQVKEWSRANQGHVPIVLQLELKQTEDPLEEQGGAVSPPWDGELLDDVDEEIHSVFTERQLITADDIRRPGQTLEETILEDGWPKLSWARGKVMFFFDTGGAAREMYLDGHPNLEGRAVFTRGPVGEPDAAVDQINDPRGANTAKITDLVERGYFIRTRSDEPFDTVRNDELSRVETALASGAQLVTTDFPTVGMAARYDSDFVAELPGGATVRCNPVTAPRWCRDGDLEP